MPKTAKSKKKKTGIAMPEALARFLEAPTGRTGGYYGKLVKHRMLPEVEDEELRLVGGVVDPEERRKEFWLNDQTKIRVAGYKKQLAERLMARTLEWATYKLNQMPHNPKVDPDEEKMGAVEHILVLLGYSPDQV